MKKFNKLLKLALSAFLVITLASCSKANIDDNGVYLSTKDAAKAAKKNNQNVVVIATMDGTDFYSTDFINVVFNDERFKDEIAKDYVVLHLDFSEAAYQATVFNDESTKEEVKIAEKNAKIMQENTLLASRLNLQTTPAIYIMSKDMFFISELDYLTDEVTNYDSFKALLEKQSEDIALFDEKVKAATTGSKEEKLSGIDRLYEDTDIVYRAFLKDLIDEYIELDKDNETGLLPKYIIGKADIESSNYFMAEDIGNAVKVYAQCAEDPRIDAESRQMLYYMASYILVSSNSSDFEAIRGYLQKAVDAYPEGPNVPVFQNIIEQFDQMTASLTPETSTEEQAE